MFNKKIKLVFIILVFMLSLGVVSAADTNMTDDVIASDVDEEPPSGEINVLSTSEDVASSLSSDSGECELASSDASLINQNSAIADSSNRTSDGREVLSVSSDSNADAASVPNTDLNNDNANANVLPLINAKDVVKTYKSSKKFSATFFDGNGNVLKNTYVKFQINGKTYTKKTNAKGVATIALNLKVGEYVIWSIHPTGFKIANRVIVMHSITTSNLNKHYKSYKKFTATFYGKNGKVLAKKYVKFKYRGHIIVKKTNSKGKVSLKITTVPGTYKIISINPKTGEKVRNTIKVSPTLYAKKMIVFTGVTSQFKVTLYKNEKLAKNKKLKVYVDGSKRIVKTDSKGVATVKFKLSKGTYNFKSVDPYTGYVLNKKVTVKLASIKAHDIGAIENETSSFQAQLLKQNGKVAKNTKMQITINGVPYIVKTDSKGFASVEFRLPSGQYPVVCKDLKTGYEVKCKISVVKDKMGISYSKYGVSEDGKTILAIGRASAPGEESRYGYSWYMVEFERTCPYCHGHNLYWDVFWSGDETTEVAVFPATGRMEPGSTEGMIFCADCDCDFSIFGQEHITSNPRYLTIVSGPVKSSKEVAYILKSGNYVKI